MLIGKALAVSGAVIHLSQERWFHIVENHVELAGLSHDILVTIESPFKVVQGHSHEFLAIKPLKPKYYLVVVYKETSVSEGFIITAFITSHVQSISKRGVVWPPKS